MRPPQKQHSMERPPSTQCMYGLMYALQELQRKGPLAVQSMTCGSRWGGERACLCGWVGKRGAAEAGGNSSSRTSLLAQAALCHTTLPHLHRLVPGVLQRQWADDGHKGQAGAPQDVRGLGHHVEVGAHEAGPCRPAVAHHNGRVGSGRDGVRALTPRLKHLHMEGRLVRGQDGGGVVSAEWQREHGSREGRWLPARRWEHIVAAVDAG